MKHTNIPYLSDLKASYRNYFESYLAAYILREANKLNSVIKISTKILYLIDKNEKTVLELFEKDKAILPELYNQHMFGRLDDTPVAPTQALNEVKLILKENTQLDKVIHVHSIFAYRIYFKLPDKSCFTEKQPRAITLNNMTQSQIMYAFSGVLGEQVDVLREMVKNEFYRISSLQDRGRSAEQNKNAKNKQILGSNTCKFFKNHMQSCNLNTTYFSHLPACNIYKVDCNSEYVKAVYKLGLPYIAGYSFHTVTLLLGATLYGNFNQQEMMEYCLGIFAYLAAGGNHTFHEIYTPAYLLAGVPYAVGEYFTVLPKQFSESFREYVEAEKDNISQFIKKYFPADDENNAENNLCKNFIKHY